MIRLDIKIYSIDLYIYSYRWYIAEKKKLKNYFSFWSLPLAGYRPMGLQNNYIIAMYYLHSWCIVCSELF